MSTDIGDTAAIVPGHGLITPPEPDAISAAWSEAVPRRAEFAPRLLGSRERFSHTRMTASYRDRHRPRLPRRRPKRPQRN